MKSSPSCNCPFFCLSVSLWYAVIVSSLLRMRVKETCSLHYSMEERPIQYFTIRYDLTIVCPHQLLTYVWLTFCCSCVKAGENCIATRESSEHLKSLTQQALSLQKGTEHVSATDLTPSTRVHTLLWHEVQVWLSGLFLTSVFSPSFPHPATWWSFSNSTWHVK